MDSEFVIELWLAQMSPEDRKEVEESWPNTKPIYASKLTGDELEAYCREQHEAEEALKRDEGWERMRERLLRLTDAVSNHSESELYRTAKELLNTIDKAQAEPSSVSRYESRKFRTDFRRCEALVEAEIRKLKKVETGKDNGVKKRGKALLDEQVGKLLESFPEISGLNIAKRLNEIYAAQFKDTTAEAVRKTESWRNRSARQKDGEKK
jgi:hypothetical protein